MPAKKTTASAQKAAKTAPKKSAKAKAVEKTYPQAMPESRAKKPRRGTPSAPPPETPAPPAYAHREVWIVILILLTLVLALAEFGGDTSFLVAIRNLSRGLLGGGSFLLPLLTLGCVIQMIRVPGKAVHRSMWCMAGLPILAGTLLHLLSCDQELSALAAEAGESTVYTLFRTGITLQTGGLLAGGLAYILRRVLTDFGAMLISLMLTVLLCLGTARTTVSEFFSKIFRAKDSTEDEYDESALPPTAQHIRGRAKPENPRVVSQVPPIAEPDAISMDPRAQWPEMPVNPYADVDEEPIQPAGKGKKGQKNDNPPPETAASAQFSGYQMPGTGYQAPPPPAAPAAPAGMTYPDSVVEMGTRTATAENNLPAFDPSGDMGTRKRGLWPFRRKKQPKQPFYPETVAGNPVSAPAVNAPMGLFDPTENIGQKPAPAAQDVPAAQDIPTTGPNAPGFWPDAVVSSPAPVRDLPVEPAELPVKAPEAAPRGYWRPSMEDILGRSAAPEAAAPQNPEPAETPASSFTPPTDLFAASEEEWEAPEEAYADTFESAEDDDEPPFDPDEDKEAAPVISIPGSNGSRTAPAPVVVDTHLQKPEEKPALAQTVRSGETVDGVQSEDGSLPPYTFPPIDLLEEDRQVPSDDATEELRQRSQKLTDTLSSFGVCARIVNVIRGPSITRYEMLLERGVKLSRLTNLQDDIALALGASGVRIAAIPDKSVVGIEVPNKIVQLVYLRDVMTSAAMTNMKSRLGVALGKDITGECVCTDIQKMPHLLIAGTTGSGKSVCINTLIVSMLYRATPEEVRMIMIDPKMVELGDYNGIPHLLIPVVTDYRKASGALSWAVNEMERRYKLLAQASARDLASYNRVMEQQGQEKLPHIVVIIDELADLMMVAAKEVEESICRIAQKARAAGMHLIIATQRPSADVLTGLMKSNIPSRIAFAVQSQVESRIILDTGGADKLIGRGDMLFLPLGAGKPRRIQGCFVRDEEIEGITRFIKAQGQVEYSQEILEAIERAAMGEEKADIEDDEADVMLGDAVDVIMETGQASASMLQRRLKLGYARASRIIDQMEARGIVGPFDGSRPRQILISRAEWSELKLRGGLRS